MKFFSRKAHQKDGQRPVEVGLTSITNFKLEQTLILGMLDELEEAKSPARLSSRERAKSALRFSGRQRNSADTDVPQGNTDQVTVGAAKPGLAGQQHPNPGGRSSTRSCSSGTSIPSCVRTPDQGWRRGVSNGSCRSGYCSSRASSKTVAFKEQDNTNAIEVNGKLFEFGEVSEV
mmetsp:Transcript_51598/g.122783  ORF Transcript_51598/g.122783 Transcript_51598/m.122783 type:complete len:175 (+) Transcript_51598:81-605(+)